LNPRCSKAVPSHLPLSDWQKTGLKLTSSREGRDVVLAIDLTESVGLNDEGRLRLKQIIQDSLVPGDSVYIVPFSSTVNPLQPQSDSLATEAAIPFNSKEDTDRILQSLPLKSNITQQHADIQLAESAVYRGLGQLNQCRLTANKSVRSQSVVWLTDAPLLTKPGINSTTWVETPATSPFRQRSSSESQERQEWIDALPLKLRSQKIGNYNLSVVDIAPTVQEFCTPVPGGRETCLVNGYLLGQLWLPVLVISTAALGLLGGGVWLFRYWQSLRKSWKLVISGEDDSEPQIHYLRNHQKLSIGGDIECRGGDIRGYLRREGNQIFLEPLINEGLEIYYRNQRITQKQSLSGNQVRLNCPHNSHDSELTININY
jgi:hypothetical protein